MSVKITQQLNQSPLEQTFSTRTWVSRILPSIIPWS